MTPYVRSLFYNREYNIMEDEKGNVIFNIFDIISPSTLFLFKHKKEWMLMDDVHGNLIELVYSKDGGVCDD